MMIIFHQDQVAAFAGAHTFYWPGQVLIQPDQVAAPPAATAARLLLINPPGLDGGFGTGLSQC